MMNKYERWYNQLIARGRGREPPERSECHHIVPRAMGGGNESENLVRLTYREHFLAHWLLIKFTVGRDQVRMLAALGCMSARSKLGPIISSWKYARARQAAGDAKRGQPSRLPQATRDQMSTRSKGNQYALGHRHDPEFIERLAASQRGNKHTLGRKLSDDHKERISRSMLGNQRTKGRKLSPEHVAALRAGHARYWRDR